MYTISSETVTSETPLSVPSSIDSMKRNSYAMVGRVAEGGSRWRFHKLAFMSINVITKRVNINLHNIVIGGKGEKRKKTYLSTPKFTTKQSKVDYYQSAKVIDFEVSDDEGNSSGAELSFNEELETETSEDRAMIDDREVIEEYIPMNYMELKKDNELNTDDIDSDVVLESNNADLRDTTKFKEKIIEMHEKIKQNDDNQNAGVNLETGLVLSDYVVDKGLIERMKKRQQDAIDHNLKPIGECAYYSILMGILHAQSGKPVHASWKRKWDSCESMIKPVEIVEIVKRFQEKLKYCLLSILMSVLRELNVIRAL